MDLYHIYYEENVKEGNWLVNLDEGDAFDTVLDAIENHQPVTTTNVSLKLRAKYGGHGELGSCQLTKSQALRLVELTKSYRKDHANVEMAELQLTAPWESPILFFCMAQLAPMFSKVEVCLKFITNFKGTLSLSTANGLNKALLQSKSRLQELVLKNCILERESAEVLCQGLGHMRCPLRRLYLDDVEYHATYFEGNSSEEMMTIISPFALALAKNKTLEEVTFLSSFEANQDTTLFEIFHQMSILDQPPKWKTFTLRTKSLARTISIHGHTKVLVNCFARMLRSPHQCPLIELHLDKCSLGFQGKVYARDILKSLLLGLQQETNTSSIQVLSLNDNGFDTVDLKCIMDCISRCPNLRQVELKESFLLYHFRNCNTDLNWLTESLLWKPHAPTQLCKLFIADHLNSELGFGDNEEAKKKRDAEIEAVIPRLLFHNPLLYDLGDCPFRKRMPKVSHWMDINQFVGLLRLPIPLQVQEGEKESDQAPLAEIPISFWPKVLERTNRQIVDDHPRCATVLHHILKNAPGLLEF